MKKLSAPEGHQKLSVPTQADQAARFIETARALGADEDEAVFKAKLATIARQQPVNIQAPKVPKENKS